MLKKYENLQMYEILQQSQVEGDVGIEIEVETRRSVDFERSVKGWRTETDGSLRGNGAEFVLRQPQKRDDAMSSLNYLRKNIETRGYEVKHSFRAGVHIHINVQRLTLKQVANFLAVYWSMEDVLLRFCGQNREGNLFCLRLRDAEFPLLRFMNVLANNETLSALHSDTLRYSSLNLKALTQYGSLEFRGMETTPDFSKIPEWIDILLAIRQYAINLENTSDIAYSISAMGPETWARGIIGDELFDQINCSDFEELVMQNMREVQPLIFYT